MRKINRYTVIIIYKNRFWETNTLARTKKEALNFAIEEMSENINISKSEIKKYTKYKFNVSVEKS